VDISMLVLK